MQKKYLPAFLVFLSLSFFSNSGLSMMNPQPQQPGNAPYNPFLFGVRQTMYWVGINMMGQQVSGILNSLFHSFVTPRTERMGAKFLTPYLYDMAQEGHDNEESIDDLIFSKTTKIEISAYLFQLKRAMEQNDPLPLLLLYGPPGTGKTELAKRIANKKWNVVVKTFVGAELAESDGVLLGHVLDWLNQNKGDPGASLLLPNVQDGLVSGFLLCANLLLGRWSIGPAWTQNAWMVQGLYWLGARPVKQKWWGKPRRKAILIFDEAEAILKAALGLQRAKSTSTFLSKTGSGSPYFTVIATTNFVEKVDDASYDRFVTIKLPLPEKEERRRIFKYYLDRTISFYKKENISIELNDNLLGDSADRSTGVISESEGLSPRTIKQISEIAIAEVASLGEHKLTEEILLNHIRKRQTEEKERKAAYEASMQELRKDRAELNFGRLFSDSGERRFPRPPEPSSP